MKTTVIYHRADFDGIFCREIARKFLPEAELIGWDYGDPEPMLTGKETLYMLDISVEGLMMHQDLIWIDHHKSAIEKYPAEIPGYRIDGVAACRLAWQWFLMQGGAFDGEITYTTPDGRTLVNFSLPSKQDFIDRKVKEPLAVRLAGEYDIWDKRDPRADLFQHGLRSRELSENLWDLLLVPMEVEVDGKQGIGEITVDALLEAGEAIQYAKTKENKSIITSSGFTIQFEGLTFIACNAARYNGHLFTSKIQPEHDGCLGFNWDGAKWRVSLYGVPGKPDVDLSVIAVKYGGGGHKQACGFTCKELPFKL